MLAMQQGQQKSTHHDLHHTVAPAPSPPSPQWQQIDRPSTRVLTQKASGSFKRERKKPDENVAPLSDSQNSTLKSPADLPTPLLKRTKRLSTKQQGEACLKKSWDDMQAQVQRGTASPVLHEAKPSAPLTTNAHGDGVKTFSLQPQSQESIAWIAKYGDDWKDDAAQVTENVVKVGVSLAERLKPRQ